MRRDIGNEVIVAIAAVAVMVFAIAFAVLLSLSSSTDAVEDITPTGLAVVGTVEGSVVATVTETPLSVIVAATEMAANTLTNVFSQLTIIPGPTKIAIPETVVMPTEVVVVATEIPPTETATPSPTVTATHTDLPTSTSTATATTTPSVTFTPSLTSTGTVTPAPTATDTLTPSATPSTTPTNTVTATFTSTATATPTATDTATLTPAPTDTATATLVPVSNSEIRPTSIRTPLVTSTTITRGNCELPDGWSMYTVQPGNTLFSIARAVDSTVSELGLVNCLTNANLIITGDMLFVPHLPTEPVKTGVPRTTVDGVTASDTSVVGCTDPRVQIVDPHPGQKISGVFAVAGTAYLDDFWYYNIEVRPASAAIYNFYSRHETPVVNEHLGAVDSEIFESGLHWVRITVVDQGGGIPDYAVCAIPLVFE